MVASPSYGSPGDSVVIRKINSIGTRQQVRTRTACMYLIIYFIAMSLSHKMFITRMEWRISKWPSIYRESFECSFQGCKWLSADLSGNIMH